MVDSINDGEASRNLPQAFQVQCEGRQQLHPMPITAHEQARRKCMQISSLQCGRSKSLMRLILQAAYVNADLGDYR
jgi:hypothetical protein